MTVQELIEELQVYVDIGYGWIDVVSHRYRRLKLEAVDDSTVPRLVITEED